ncbi:MAG: hypothetical protein IKQ03_04045 [Prevotella sp.]|nr:hypothetical protein [Prevotella sp.]
MKRNLIIIVAIFLGIIALMLTGNIITIGEKIAHVTRVWYLEYVFYGVILVLLLWLVVWPIIRVHRAPVFPVLAVDQQADETRLKAFGDKLAANCGYIQDNELRQRHRKQLQIDMLHATGDIERLRNVVQQEIDLRFKGDKQLGVLGINDRIREWAKTVFMVTAISQNSRFDSLSVMYMNYKLIEDVILASGFRPNNRQLFRMYASILTTALITYALSEALSGTSAVHPFDFGDMHDHADGAADVATDATDAAAGADYIDYEDIDIASEMADTEGLSVYSILRRIKIPGVVVGSAIDGTLNALMTLRIGYVTRTYLQQGPRAMKGVQNKRKVKLQAMKEAVVAVPSIVVSGSDIVGKKASRLILNVLKRTPKPQTTTNP